MTSSQQNKTSSLTSTQISHPKHIQTFQVSNTSLIQKNDFCRLKKKNNGPLGPREQQCWKSHHSNYPGQSPVANPNHTDCIARKKQILHPFGDKDLGFFPLGLDRQKSWMVENTTPQKFSMKLKIIFKLRTAKSWSSKRQT